MPLMKFSADLSLNSTVPILRGYFTTSFLSDFLKNKNLTHSAVIRANRVCLHDKVCYWYSLVASAR